MTEIITRERIVRRSREFREASDAAAQSDVPDLVLVAIGRAELLASDVLAWDEQERAALLAGQVAARDRAEQAIVRLQATETTADVDPLERRASADAARVRLKVTWDS